MLFFLAIYTCEVIAQGDYKKVGYASFYHDKFEGRTTSNGEKFRQKKMTCAHRTLPFGTMVKVTNLSNQKSVVVRVNDRGPYAKGRIIDLSKAAARELDFIRAGVAKVEVEVVAETITDTVVAVSGEDTLDYSYEIVDSFGLLPNGFSIQVGNFAHKDNMERMVKQLKREAAGPVYVWLKSEGGKKNYHVLAGLFETRSAAFGYLDKMIVAYPGAFIVHLKKSD